MNQINNWGNMNNKESVEKGGHYFKYVIGILFLAFVGTLISLALLDVLGYEDISIYVLWVIWAVILSLYCWNTEPEKYPQYTETPWEARSRYVGELCSFAFMAFLYTVGSLAALGMLLKWILAIDIIETGYAYRLIFLTWGGWIIGLHVWFREQEKRKSQKQ
ncbi:MAG: hypothetical protein A2418_02170 [Candidatus Brennerbacteria bacterium RIFOXYC1_FULL_41_11]|uniref:Uncharacterized protein n=1 Tax=Candidatus Brennerbacteria bacterium RIFOXYD1_FULL_41_16 TaxID=1797529 RepID=A0A1G1XMD5_9BACT|nr:MAG: hypothetical protein A2418_02170 [Candidatus Brennerbacteria bacterium RIFOXYC1_FULL_41_11]OGY40760.1 MAG: hypothetical protein A2570_01380 [Candidatus Brennerbacteria bacterium RIFOXYD1_FULL_41_16]